MANVDYDGPLKDFYVRTNHIRKIMVAIESAARSPDALKTTRASCDLTSIGPETGNTVNAMSLVFLASSFEEFIREEIGQCADHLSQCYVKFTDSKKVAIRGSYWDTLVSRFSFNKSILTKQKPKTIDASSFAKVRVLVESARSFVIDEDVARLDRENFYHHRHNFRPHVVDELAMRVGIGNIIDSAADGAKIKAYFGVTKKSDSAKLLRAKLNDFYEKRNLVVHSLSGSTGYAVDMVLDYIGLFEMTADSIVSVVKRTTSLW